MKKMLNFLFIIFLLIGVFDNSAKVLAVPVEEPIEFERLSTKKLNSYCPESGRPDLVSICGRVVQATAQPEILSDGSTAPSVSRVPLKGVSVYLYECDNTSRTCKLDGLLGHPFSSTSTNEDGVFHLVGRKLENTWEYEYTNQYTNDVYDLYWPQEVLITNQSKKRYLVFKCGDYFQGIHIIPSYLDLTEIIHEVSCPKEYLPANTEEFTYVPPLVQFDFIGGVKLAAQMGIDDPDDYYPLQRAEVFDEEERAGNEYNPNENYEGLESTVQTHYERYAYQKNFSVPVILDGGDPRFTAPDYGSGKRQAIATAIGGSIISRLADLFNIDILKGKVPIQGAWWGPDCEEKYAGEPGDWTRFCNITEEQLYSSAEEFNTQTLLPSLPPTQSILYYKPLEIRNEISAYYQDHDDLAKYLGTMFSNCVGDVYKRKWETTPEDEDKPTYPDCESLKQCNTAVYSETNPETDVNINSLTANGLAQNFMAPGSLRELEEQMDPEIPVCLIDGEENPVLLSEIQRPGQLACEDGMRLCDGAAYWNSYYLTNLGNNNNALKLGYSGENLEDSYKREATASGEPTDDGSDLNKEVFQKDGEGKGNPRVGAQGDVSSSGDVEGNNSGGAVFEIASGTEVSSTETLVNFLDQPFENDDDKKEIFDGTPYYISTRPVAWGQFSKTNEYPEKIITSESQDSEYLDNHAFSKEMECESCGEEHYPEDIFLENNVITKGKEGSGSRTPFEGITVTSAADDRIKNLETGKWPDRVDSAISVSTGHSYIDWRMVKMKGSPPSLGDSIIDFFNKLFNNFFRNEKTEDKTFIDREPNALTEAKNNGEFEINDELISYNFKVNESNFTDLFPCNAACDLTTDWHCWPEPDTEEERKAVNECYPWQPTDYCGTKPNTCGEISRTCRVDTCEKGTITVTYICDGQETAIDSATQDTPNGNCSESVLTRCAVEQYTNGDKRDLSAPSCKGKVSGQYTDIRPYDYCTVSVAGPNICDGDILLDAEVAVHSQIVDEQDKNSPRSFNADEVPESGLNLYKAFREPFSIDISPVPAAWVSVSSSLSETEPDVSIRKDIPGIGSGASFLTRARFGEPHKIKSSNLLEPLYIHCANEELGTEGTWNNKSDCEFAILPDPEILTTEYLENELYKEIDEGNTQCLLNENIDSCEALFLGESESGEPLKFSKTFKLILNLAGSKFKLKPAAILAYMHKLGADKEYSYYWSEEGEEDLKKATLPWWGAFPFCDDLEPVKQPPYDWKLSWFSEKLKDVVKGADSPTAELERMFKRQDTASRCNFIDSTFTLAAAISKRLVVNNGTEDVHLECSQQAWDGLMTDSMKIQYYQLQINPDEEELKGQLKTINIFGSDTKYQEIWNACK